jgi:ankyrin repeat protein
MQRKVKRVFKALSKKGMIRAFVETGKKEYVYPLITQNQTKKALKNIIFPLLGMVFLLAAGMAVFNLLLKDKPADSVSVSHKNSLDYRDRYGMTALHRAAIRGNIETIKDLIEKGAEINARDNYGWTPLHWAVFKQDEIMCRSLVQSGASIAVTSSRPWFKFPAGITAVEMAKITNNKAVQAILVRETKRK